MSSSRRSATLIVLSCFLLVSTTTAFNITRLLGRYPDFSNLNDLLTKTELAGEINNRKTITVLAIANGAIGGLMGKPDEVQKGVLSNHVVLDYYDMMKLGKLKNRSTITTLYQTTGVAQEGQGFLHVTHRSDGNIMFGSAVKGAPQDSQLLGSVASQPYNISVLQVSQPIVAPGMDGSYPIDSPAPKSSAPTPAPTSHKKKPSPPAEAPATSEEDDDDDVDDTKDAPTPTPSDDADSPAPSDGPSADSPKANDDGPAADSADDKAADEKSTGNVTGASFALAVVLASSLALLFH